MKSQQKTLTLWIVVILLMALVAKVSMENRTKVKFIKYPEFIRAVEEKKIDSVVFKGSLKSFLLQPIPKIKTNENVG